MKKTALCFAMAVVASLFAGGFAFGQEGPPAGDGFVGGKQVSTAESGAEYVPGELVVSSPDGVEIVKVKEKSLDGLKAKAKELKEEKYKGKDAAVGPNLVYRATVAPNDQRYGDQYHLPQIGAPGAWNDEKGDGRRVCGIDTGYDRDHPDLAPKVVAERDVVAEPNDDSAGDNNGHGTHTAGLAAAATDNGLFVAGVGWSTKLVIVKALDANGKGLTEWTAQGIRYCAGVPGVVAINMSFGNPVYDAVVEREVNAAWNAGIVPVASAGNDQTNAPTYPAASPNVIGVSATNRDGSFATAYSNYGSYVDLAAPGTQVFSTYPDDRVAYLTGTSMSAPQVAGAAALVSARGLSRDQVVSRLFQNAEDRGAAGKDPYYGHGFLNANCAVTPTDPGC